MLAALIFGQALAHAPLPPCPQDCVCPPGSNQPYEEVHLGGDFFVGEGGVGPAFAPPVYSGGGYFVEGSGSGFGFTRAGASASASASASARASVSVRVSGGGRTTPGKPGGHGGGKRY